MVALGGMVVNHVQDHLDAFAVQSFDQSLEFPHLLADHAGNRIARVRREEADRIVAPIVGQAAIDEMFVGDELVHRHELHRGNAQRVQVLEHRRAGQSSVGTAQALGHLWVARGEAFDVQLVN